eukprot:COSAG01_NODE_30780_length_609_cov_5.625490_1_plen_96_part_00
MRGATHVNRHALFILKVCPLQLRLQSTKSTANTAHLSAISECPHVFQNLLVRTFILGFLDNGLLQNNFTLTVRFDLLFQLFDFTVVKVEKLFWVV